LNQKKKPSIARRSVGPPKTPRGKQNMSKCGTQKLGEDEHTELGEDGTSDADLWKRN